MKEKKENMTETKEVSFFKRNEIKVSLTMPGFPPMVFFMREVLSAELKELRKDFLALTEEKRKAQNHIHQSRLLSMLCTRAPENPLPGFPELNGDFRESLYSFFTESTDEDEREKIGEFVDSVMTLYWRGVQPEEFFRIVQNNG